MRTVIPVIQCGLHGIVVDLEHVRALGKAAHKAPFAVLYIHIIRPDIGIRKLVTLLPARLLEPRVLIGGVSHYKIHQDPDPLIPRGIKQALDVLICTKAWIYMVVIRDIVAAVLEWRAIAGVQPDCITAKIGDIIQLFDNAGDVADTVPI